MNLKAKPLPMNVIKTVLIDDEPAVLENLQNLLAFNFPEIDVVNAALSGTDAIEIIDKERPQLVFLDIQMPGMDGFTLLERVLPKHPGLMVVFVTAYEQYAIEALRAKAIDYILKPIKIMDIRQAIDSVKRSIGAGLEDKRSRLLTDRALVDFPILAVPYSKGVEVVQSKGLLYLQADGAYSKFVLKNGKVLLVSKNLGQMEEALSQVFFRVHKSYLINMAQLARFDQGSQEAVLQNGIKLPVASRRVTPFKEELLKRFQWVS